MRRTKFGQMDEDTSIDACFDYFRRKGSMIDVLWVKEQVYRTSCVPERCPSTRSLCEILISGNRRGDREEGDEDEEEEDGEIVVVDDTKFRFN